ncbi:hypothetical protein BHK69_11430 [Bosea vaviloviae]|uniref:Uncharacterized protein n=1 Tax=Bosea vaviloviae TaxID=1526658 RepID=A0A1D7U0U6_9HYPH|nr:hypothetical protein BHK69_11430 [Bosea vaviloviae]
MPFRSIVAPPEELAQICVAFEKAWEQILARGQVAPLDVAAQRERLGYIVAGLWGAPNSEQLVELAVQRFDATAVSLSPLQEFAKPRDLERPRERPAARVDPKPSG